ncbi:MAG TPA: asparaginase [Dongiaceae bacterium]|nr:asparaginase [Dongiaceae bacterium]
MADARPVGGMGEMYRPLVEIWRGDTLESVHAGAVVVADDTGTLLLTHGDPRVVTYLRSAAKPAQVLPLLASGAAERFGFTDAEIAVMTGSHGGEPFHVAAVRSILGRIGLGPEALLCGAHPPYHKPTAKALRESGEAPGALHNNCSGKHAGMLALATTLGAPTATYLEERHPVQTRIRDAVAALAGVRPETLRTATDGCSAPTFALPMAAAASLYARLMAPEALPRDLRPATARAIAAMRAHPEMVAGTGRLCTAFMQSGSSGLVAKIGAEGFYGFGYARDGRGYGVALKIGDGEGERSRTAAAIATLASLGILSEAQAAALFDAHVGPIRNHRGLLVGRVVPVLDLRTPTWSRA